MDDESETVAMAGRIGSTKLESLSVMAQEDLLASSIKSINAQGARDDKLTLSNGLPETISANTSLQPAEQPP